MCKLSDALKEKIEQTNYQQDNHLEQLYQGRQKIMKEALDSERKEKHQAWEGLNKKKEEIKKIKDTLARLQSKKVSEQAVQCGIEKEERMKYHSRPKQPASKLMAVFDEVIQGTC